MSRIALVAGEASGDLLGAALLRALRQRFAGGSDADSTAGIEAVGIGGPRLVAQGLDAWWPQERLAVRGYVEVLRHYRALSALRRQLGDRLLAAPPRVFIGVDAPDFNLGLEARLKAAGVPTVHFICPSIWAWRGGRAQRLSLSCDLVLCLFPFEPALLAGHGVQAAYVGHPLADAIPIEVPRAQARLALGLAAQAQVVALMPGSRRSEIEAILPAFARTARLLQQQQPDLRFVLPVAPGLQALVRAGLQQHASGLDVQLLDGQSHAALAACDATLIASGTATLEAALFKRPMVIGYRMHPISWQIMKRLRYQPWVGLPNILLRDFAVPECIQHDCEPMNLARQLRRQLDDGVQAQRLALRFTELHHLLRCDTARRATDALAPFIDV